MSEMCFDDFDYDRHDSNCECEECKVIEEYTNEELCEINLYECDDTQVTKEKHKIVKIRKEHECCYCLKKFEIGTKMRNDTFLNKETGEFVSLYYCIPRLI